MLRYKIFGHIMCQRGVKLLIATIGTIGTKETIGTKAMARTTFLLIATKGPKGPKRPKRR